MAVKKILLVSPKAPCGATWLLNSLLATGVRIQRNSSPEPGTFVQIGDGSYQLNEAEEQLRQHFPILMTKKNFYFVKDIEVEWTHYLPSEFSHDYSSVFLFVRDPRDALYSYYKRRNPDVSFEAFLHSVDYMTGLNQIESFDYFIKTWVEEREAKILRFEDFKTNPESYFSDFLQKIGLASVSNETILDAVDSSNITKAREAEELFADSGVEFSKFGALNRKGMAYEWKSIGTENAEGYRLIESQAAYSFEACNYEKNFILGTFFQWKRNESNVVKLSSGKQSKSIFDLCLTFLIAQEMARGDGIWGHFQNWEIELIKEFLKSEIFIEKGADPQDRDIDDITKCLWKKYPFQMLYAFLRVWCLRNTK